MSSQYTSAQIAAVRATVDSIVRRRWPRRTWWRRRPGWSELRLDAARRTALAVEMLQKALTLADRQVERRAVPGGRRRAAGGAAPCRDGSRGPTCCGRICSCRGRHRPRASKAASVPRRGAAGERDPARPGERLPDAGQPRSRSLRSATGWSTWPTPSAPRRCSECPTCARLWPLGGRRRPVLRGVRPRPRRRRTPARRGAVPAGSRPAAPTGPGRWVSSAAPVTACAGCGGTTFGAEGYCEDCGQRRAPRQGPHRARPRRDRRRHRPGPAPPPQRGRGRAGPRCADTIVAIVCDGVSSSTRPDAASNGAVDAAAPAPRRCADPPAERGRRDRAAARAAQAAAALAAGPSPAQPARLARSSARWSAAGRTRSTVGWVGDSRAYWLPDGRRRRDRAAVPDRGRLRRPAQIRSPAASRRPAGLPLARRARALARRRRHRHRAALRHFTPAGPGRVLVCSDGLFKYRPDAGRAGRGHTPAPSTGDGAGAGAVRPGRRRADNTRRRGADPARPRRASSVT